jgi:hypothetical protein
MTPQGQVQRILKIAIDITEAGAEIEAESACRAQPFQRHCGIRS